MSSNKKGNQNQPSILSFFNNACNVTGSKKRTHAEMMRGENNDKFINLEVSNSDKVNSPLIINIYLI
jgi:hypothetical protein